MRVIPETINPNLALLWPGQGGQSVRQGEKILLKSPAAQKVMKMAKDIFGGEFADTWENGPEDKVNQTRWTQAIVGTDGLMRLAALEEGSALDGEPSQYDWLIKKRENDAKYQTQEKYRDGMSFGIFIAGTGVWYTPEEGLKLINERGKIMGDFFADLKAMMFALERTPKDIRAEMLEKYSPAGIRLCLDNSDGINNQKVYGGPIDAVWDAVNWLKTDKKQTDENLTPLTDIGGVFHHPLLEPVATAFTPAVMKMEMFDQAAYGKVLMSNRTGKPLKTPDEVRAEFIYHNVEPVLHSQSMRYLVEQAGVNVMMALASGRRLPIMNQDMFRGNGRVPVNMERAENEVPVVLLYGWKAG